MQKTTYEVVKERKDGYTSIIVYKVYNNSKIKVHTKMYNVWDNGHITTAVILKDGYISCSHIKK